MGTAHARLDALELHGEAAVGPDRESVAPVTFSSPAGVVRALESPAGAVAPPDAAVPLSFASHRTKRCERRWEGFLALAASRGLSADEVASRFGADDIADLCAPEHDEAVLESCMDTLADAVRRERGLAGAEGPFARERSGAGGVDAAVPRVRCGACRHFRRRDSHPHLGDCAGGVPRTAAGGFWDDQVRGCGAFMPRRP